MCLPYACDECHTQTGPALLELSAKIPKPAKRGFFDPIRLQKSLKEELQPPQFGTLEVLCWTFDDEQPQMSSKGT